MSITRRNLLAGAAVASAVIPGLRADNHGTRYVRYRQGGKQAYGELEDDTIYPLDGTLLKTKKRKGGKVALSDVKLLYPVRSPKVFAVGLNYKSHLGDRPEPTNPEIFYKPTTSLQNPDDPIIIPPGSKNTHYEAEFVIVVGKRARRISESEAADHILGYTCGNDVSERDWQGGDLQWWRGKGCDTFGPMGPVDRERTRLHGFRDHSAPQWRSQAAAEDQRLTLQAGEDRQLHQPVRDTTAGRLYLHGNSGLDQRHEAR